MQDYHTDSDVILEYINTLEATQKKSKRGTGNNPITDTTLLPIATNAMLKTGAHPRTTDKWEDLNTSTQTWDAWKTSYKTADIKERFRRFASGENAAHGALRQAGAPQGTAIDDLVNKYDLEDYFNNLAAAATIEKVVLEHLTASIAALTTNRKALVATNAKLAAEVTNFTRRLGQNSGSKTSGTTEYKQIPRTCPYCKKEGFRKPDTCLELEKNSSNCPPNWKHSL